MAIESEMKPETKGDADSKAQIAQFCTCFIESQSREINPIPVHIRELVKGMLISDEKNLLLA
jgi:hypothetical protein